MTKTSTSFTYVTYVRSSPGAVFDAITVPSISRQFWGHENISDWTPGARWEHIRDNDSRPVEIVGKVVEIASPSRLVTTWASASREADPDAYSRVTYDVIDYGSMVRLTVTHDQLEAGSGMAIGVAEGWPLVLSSLKSFLETGEGIDQSAEPKAA